MPHLPAAEQTWVNVCRDKAKATLAMRFALMINTFESHWIFDRLTGESCYESQSVLSALEGEAIREYWTGKLETFRRARDRGFGTVADVGTVSGGEPCTVVYTRDNAKHRGWLETPSALALFKATPDGSVDRIDICVVAPSPGTARAAQRFPGLAAKPVQEKIEAPADDSALRFTVLILGASSLDVQMLRNVERTRASFANSTLQVYRFDRDFATVDEICRKHGIFGFPSLLVESGDEVLLKQQGVISAESILETLKGKGE